MHATACVVRPRVRLVAVPRSDQDLGRFPFAETSSFIERAPVPGLWTAELPKKREPAGVLAEQRNQCLLAAHMALSRPVRARERRVTGKRARGG